MLAADLTAQGLIAFANSLDPDQAQQHVGLDPRPKLFDNLILFLQSEEENIEYYKSFQITVYFTQKIPSMQKAKTGNPTSSTHVYINYS